MLSSDSGQVADYILSDVHLRYDRPDRGERLARVVSEMGRIDRLVIVGDLCDFWLASRQQHLDIPGTVLVCGLWSTSA